MALRLAVISPCSCRPRRLPRFRSIGNVIQSRIWCATLTATNTTMQHTFHKFVALCQLDGKATHFANIDAQNIFLSLCLVLYKLHRRPCFLLAFRSIRRGVTSFSLICPCLRAAPAHSRRSELLPHFLCVASSISISRKRICWI